MDLLASLRSAVILPNEIYIIQKHVSLSLCDHTSVHLHEVRRIRSCFLLTIATSFKATSLTRSLNCSHTSSVTFGINLQAVTLTMAAPTAHGSLLLSPRCPWFFSLETSYCCTQTILLCDSKDRALGDIK